MKLQVTYQIGTGKTTQVFPTPQKANAQFEKIYHRLSKRVKDGDYCNCIRKSTNPYILDANITASIKGKYITYKLQTNISEI